MTIKNKINLLFAFLILLCVINYGIFFDQQTIKDELLLAGSLTTILLLYFLLIIPFFKSLSMLLKIAEEKSGIQEKAIKDELKVLEKTMENSSETIEKAIAFVQDIKAGNHDSKIIEDESRLVEGSLINALFGLRNQMVQIEEEEKERKWVAEGMSKFVEILRSHNGDIEGFYNNLTSNIVKYLGAKQGGLFLVDEDNVGNYLSLVACYAFDRKKYLHKRIEIGEGLLGQTFLEKQTTMLKKVPENYITITSGLGEAEPAYLLIVPFKLNESVECVIELASFSEFKKYQIEFLEKLGESIASTISTMRINDKTKKLLAESIQQTELMKSQEEELKQNMEELEATQEEMRRKEQEMLKMVEKLSQGEHMLEEQRKTLIEIINKLPQKIFLKDKDGKFLLANNAVADAHHLTVEELLGKSDFDFFDLEAATEYRNKELEIIEAGEPVYFPEEIFKDKNGNDKILQTTKMPFFIGYLNQVGLLGIQTDITEKKALENEIKKARKGNKE